MPVVHPADIWRASGRYDAIGPELARFKDRNGRDMVLAMTHEEVVGLLLADIVRSYRQLPMQVYHFQTKWRDEPRARGGLIRVREFVMKDAYSCDRDEAGLDASYWAQHGAYVRTFERLGLETIAVSSDVGMMGGSQAHEFMVLNPAGEDVLVLCEACDYAANRQVAIVPKAEPAGGGAARRSRRSTTPGTTTIATLAAFLGVGAGADGQGRVLRDRRRPARDGHRPRRPRGQRDQAGQRGRGRPAASGRRTVEEIKAAGMEPGYGSPIGAHDTVVVIDDLVARSPNLVAGANREGFHYRNVNVGRDYTPDVVADITNAQEGDPCPNCGEPVILRNGIEVGNIFKLGTKYTDAARRDLPRRGRRGAPDRHGLVRHRRRAERRLHRRGAPRRQGHRLAGRGRAVRRAPRVDRGGQGAAGRRDRRAAPRPRRRGRSAPRDPVGRPRRVARRQVHRRRAARHALDPDRVARARSRPAAIEVTERATGERVDAPDRGGRGAAGRAASRSPRLTRTG